MLRLASVLWRLRRATAIETALFEIAESPHSRAEHPSNAAAFFPQLRLATRSQHTQYIAQCFLRVLELPDGAFPLLNRYEHTLWRQARQLVLTLESLRRRQYASRRRLRPAFAAASEGSGEDV